MRALWIAVLLTVSVSAIGANPPQLTGGIGTIDLGSYAKRILVVDEATEKVTAEIPLTKGIPWSVRLSADGSRFYIGSAD